MLGMNDEDDEHLCIKCNETIIGLNNYVQHRKNLCNKPKKPAEEECSEIAFFQSLQLQSSSVKRPVAAAAPPPSSGAKSAKGVLTRRAIAAILASSSSVPNKRGEDWIGGHSLRVTECEDNQTRLIKAVANISGATRKEVIAAPTYSLLDEFKHEDDSDDDTDELDVDDMDDFDHHQTDGPWKAIAPHAVTASHKYAVGRESATHWVSAMATPEHEQLDDWPPDEEHTGGKWTSKLPDVDDVAVDDDDDEGCAPPPEHTKGKWVPGAKDGRAHIMDAMATHKKGGAVVYWCGPCNRRLGSRAVYDRHLMSKLHLKRVLPEKDLECSGTTIKSEPYNPSKRIVVRSCYLKDYVCPLPNSKTSLAYGIAKPKRKRRRTFVNCPVCKYKVRAYLMGKHLISHYHCRKSDLNNEFDKQQILDNIHNIVKQSPFQCQPCKFYANWQAEFMRHWRTPQHKETMESYPGKFWCSFCKFECETYAEISEHLIEDDHQQVIATTNRSIPIVVRKRVALSCARCATEFRYNAQLRRHAKTSCPVAIGGTTASDDYQGVTACPLCALVFKSKLGAARHARQKHAAHASHECAPCSARFASREEVLAHRRGQAHRLRLLRLRLDRGHAAPDPSRHCPHCDAPPFEDVVALKRHLRERHAERAHACRACGRAFALPQGLVWHARRGECPGSASADPLANRRRSKNECLRCGMCFDTRATLREHALSSHGVGGRGGSRTEWTAREGEKVVGEKELNKRFICSTCGEGFNKKFSLQQHSTRHEGRAHACDVPGCEYRARNAAELRSHALVVHTNRRPHECDECDYRAKTSRQLTRHKLIHTADKKLLLKCSLCSYATHGQIYLQRHFKMHADSRQFRCRLCTFKCNRLENLRKHILSTSFHSDAYLYECSYCPSDDKYVTNFAKEFREHLMASHNSLYPDYASTVHYVGEYFRCEPTEIDKQKKC